MTHVDDLGQTSGTEEFSDVAIRVHPVYQQRMRSWRGATYAVPMMELAPPDATAGRAGRPLPLPDAAAGVGPAWKGEAPSVAGAERS